MEPLDDTCDMVFVLRFWKQGSSKDFQYRIKLTSVPPRKAMFFDNIEDTFKTIRENMRISFGKDQKS